LIYFYYYIFFFIKASHFNAEVHLHCGSREKIGVPSEAMSTSPPPISSSYNHGWSRLAYNDPPNPTTLINDHMTRTRLIVTTPRPFLDKNFSKSHMLISNIYSHLDFCYTMTLLRDEVIIF
jgi:hypothetical protein